MMMNFDETIRVLTTFYMDCAMFHSKQCGDPHKATQLALADVKSIKHNPFSPNGEKLNTEAHSLFIETLLD